MEVQLDPNEVLHCPACGEVWCVCVPERIELLGKIAVLENEVACQRRHAENWQRLAGHYDDIRYALRNAPDTPAGHAEFYNECAELIFGADY